MDKSADNNPEFFFVVLVGIDNYKEWAHEIEYSLEFVELLDYLFLSKENLKPVPIILNNNELADDIKRES